MYAVIKTGGKQYKVAEGDMVLVEKLEPADGEGVEFNDVLMLVDGDQVEVGAPFVAGAKVAGKVVEQGRHKKVQIVKFKRRKHHLKRQGHKQLYTKVEITGIAKG
jgi:large subunit ribosomal protein L21